MALQPVGPLPASTYWRRRVILLLGVLVLLLVVSKACDGSPKNEALQGPASSPSPSPSRVTVVAPTKPATSPSPSSPAPLQSCRDAVLQVTAESDAAAYASGASPRFTLTVRNIGSVACRRALGPGAVELRVLSGEDRIWSSDDCNSSKDQGVLTLPAGAARATTVAWSGKRTRPGCVIGEVAQPGTYRVSARVGDIVRQGSVFRVTA